VLSASSRKTRNEPDIAAQDTNLTPTRTCDAGLTGVDNPRSVTLAPRHRRPTYIAETLDALLEPYPEVTQTESGAVCGGWSASAGEDGTVHVDGRGAAVDGLRALARVAWTTQDKRGSLDPAQVAGALGTLATAGLRI